LGLFLKTQSAISAEESLCSVTRLENKKMAREWEQIISMLHQIRRHLRDLKDISTDTLAVEIDWDRYLNLLALDGTMVVVGIPEKKAPIGAYPLIIARRSLAGSVIGGIQETKEMLDFCSKHNLSSDIETIPIQKVNEAYERVVKSDVRYRFVIDMKSLESRD
jgi:alcohol dehydrogenase (NADP+)